MATPVYRWDVGGQRRGQRPSNSKEQKALRRAVIYFNKTFTQVLKDRVFNYPWDRTDGELYDTGDLYNMIRGELFFTDNGYDIVVTAPDYLKYHNSMGQAGIDGEKITNWALKQDIVEQARNAVERELMNYLAVTTFDVNAHINELVGYGRG